MGRAFTAIGTSVLIGAVVWWEAFYSKVQRYLGTSGPLPYGCLYSASAACGVVASVAQLLGASAYHPSIFWAGCASVLIGLALSPVRRNSFRRKGGKIHDARVEASPLAALGMSWSPNMAQAVVHACWSSEIVRNDQRPSTMLLVSVLAVRLEFHGIERPKRP
jgi:hypothetical protein